MMIAMMMVIKIAKMKLNRRVCQQKKEEMQMIILIRRKRDQFNLK